jgi:hypothetical protein
MGFGKMTELGGTIAELGTGVTGVAVWSCGQTCKRLGSTPCDLRRAHNGYAAA